MDNPVIPGLTRNDEVFMSIRFSMTDYQGMSEDPRKNWVGGVI